APRGLRSGPGPRPRRARPAASRPPSARPAEREGRGSRPWSRGPPSAGSRPRPPPPPATRRAARSRGAPGLEARGGRHAVRPEQTGGAPVLDGEARADHALPQGGLETRAVEPSGEEAGGESVAGAGRIDDGGGARGPLHEPVLARVVEDPAAGAALEQDEPQAAAGQRPEGRAGLVAASHLQLVLAEEERVDLGDDLAPVRDAVGGQE